MTFSREIKKGSMREVVNGVYTILRTDEELMRLLWNPPEDIGEGILHPMDIGLPNITITENCTEEVECAYWDIVDKAIKVAEKVSDIEEDAMCRLYIYSGRRRPVFDNYLIAKQEVVIDVFVHESFSGDMRMEWINDRINELVALERVSGALGLVEYAGGQGWQAPIGYSKYQHRFVFGTSKK